MAARTADFISICSGGGGLDAGVRLAVPHARCVCYVEREVTEAGVLAKGIESGWLDDAPIWSDLGTFDGPSWRGLVDGIVGGFPCQPHSFAGKRLGEADERNLWPLVARLVFDIAPRWCLFENVPGILDFYYRDIRPDLQSLGYEVAEGIFSAEEVGAPHLRERLFILAYRAGLQPRPGGEQRTGASEARHRSEELADALDGAGGPEHEQQHGQRPDLVRRGGDALADAGDGQLPQPWRGQEGRAGPRPDGADVEHTADIGHERGRLTRGWRSRSEDSDRDLGNTEGQHLDVHPRWREEGSGAAFPPGPSDADGWERWLADRPGTEPALRRGADGLAFRGDRLRVLGNGVVPVAAANALRSLAAGMELEL